MRITERHIMTPDRISQQITTLPPDVPKQDAEKTEQAKRAINRDELLEWRKSLETKCQLLNLLDKGGYVKDFKDIKTDVERALADLDVIIKTFPEVDFALNINKL